MEINASADLDVAQGFLLGPAAQFFGLYACGSSGGVGPPCLSPAGWSIKGSDTFSGPAQNFQLVMNGEGLSDENI